MNTRFLSRVVAAIGTVLVIMPSAWAQYTEGEEPNQPCAEAEYIGILGALPADLTGELVLTGEDPPGDVDFFTFEFTPGTTVRAELRGSQSGSGTLLDPYLGLFDSQCGFIAANDDYQSLESRLDFVVPEDGTFTLAATGCCDSSFDGYHWYQGTYLLVISEPPPPIEAIIGRVVDAITGEPLPGSMPPYAGVELRYCDELGNCYYGVNYVSTDEFGVFRFETDWNGNPLEPGEYLVAAWATGYESADIGPFNVASGELYDLGDVPLQPPPLVFENIVPCGDIPTDGANCRYTVDVRNNTNDEVRGLGWSMVYTWGNTSPVGFSNFQADRVNRVRLPALSSSTMSFKFKVPAAVAEGTTMCVDVWFAERETGFFGTLVPPQQVFCVFKQYDTMQVIEPKAAAAIVGPYNFGTGARGPNIKRP